MELNVHLNYLYTTLKRCMYISHQQYVDCLSFQPYNVNIIKNSNKMSTLIILQNNTAIISRKGCNLQVYVYHINNVSVVGHYGLITYEY